MNAFEQKIISIHKQRGKAWLEELPGIVRQLSEEWKLNRLKSVDNLSYNYVMAGFQNNVPIILKLNPDGESLRRETKCLREFSGHGAVLVINEKEGAMLLQRAVPGTSLRGYFPDRDDEAVRIAIGVMQRLHQASIRYKSEFPTIEDWLAILDKDWDIPSEILRKARGLKKELLRTSGKRVLLHGDLHHDNILSNSDEWLAIDPKGVIGEAAFEIAPFIFNPEKLTPDIIFRRINLFSQLLGLSAERITKWCFVQAVLSWAWDLEDSLDPVHSIIATDLMQKVIDYG
jgi:streptomycin 6-kinase